MKDKKITNVNIVKNRFLKHNIWRHTSTDFMKATKITNVNLVARAGGPGGPGGLINRPPLDKNRSPAAPGHEVWGHDDNINEDENSGDNNDDLENSPTNDGMP